MLFVTEKDDEDYFILTRMETLELVNYIEHNVENPKYSKIISVLRNYYDSVESKQETNKNLR